MKPVPHGKPYAGKLHVRFDEGADVPDEGRPALLYYRSEMTWRQNGRGRILNFCL